MKNLDKTSSKYGTEFNAEKEIFITDNEKRLLRKIKVGCQELKVLKQFNNLGSIINKKVVTIKMFSKAAHWQLSQKT